MTPPITACRRAAARRPGPRHARGLGRRAARRADGLAAVEFALVLPILLILLLCVVDFGRAIQAEMILLNLSREGANLSSRGALSLQSSSQAIIESLVSTAPPLDMGGRGMIYITRVMGYKGSGGTLRNVVLEQYRWDDRAKGSGYNSSRYAPASRVWSCPGWGSDGSCSNIGSGENAPTVDLMPGALADGDVIYAVESFYNFDMFFSGRGIGPLNTPTIGPNLYSMTVF